MPILLFVVALFKEDHLLSFKIHVNFPSFMGNYIVSQCWFLGVGLVVSLAMKLETAKVDQLAADI